MSAVAALRTIIRQVLESTVGMRPPLPRGVPGREVLAKRGDHRYYHRRLKKYGPIYTTLWGERISVCVVGFQRGARLLAQHAQYLLGASVELRPMVKGGVIRCMMGGEHARYRKVLLAGMRPELPTRLEPQLRSIVRAVLDDLAGGRITPFRPDRTPLATATELIATRAVITWMCGVAPTHPTARTLEATLLEMGPAEMPGNQLDAHQKDCLARLQHTVQEWVDALRANGGSATFDGVLPRLVAERDADLDETVVGNVSYALQQGRYDMGGLLRWVISHLTDYPEAADAIRGESPESASTTSTFAEAVVYETLRLEQATALHRVALEELEFDGYRIPKGAFVKLPLREGPHLDPAVFDDPERFNPARFVGRTYAADEYAPFGFGEHRCLGSHLVMKTASLVAEEISRRYTWTRTGDNRRSMGRYHWEPAPTFDIRLSPIGK